MTVKQAIEALKKCPPNAVLIVIEHEEACEVDIKGSQAGRGPYDVFRQNPEGRWNEMRRGSDVVVLD